MVNMRYQYLPSGALQLSSNSPCFFIIEKSIPKLLDTMHIYKHFLSNITVNLLSDISVWFPLIGIFSHGRV